MHLAYVTIRDTPKRRKSNTIRWKDHKIISLLSATLKVATHTLRMKLQNTQLKRNLEKNDSASEKKGSTNDVIEILRII